MSLSLDNGIITGRALLDTDCDDRKEVCALLLRKDTFLTVFLLVTDCPGRSGHYTRIGISSVRS